MFNKNFYPTPESVISKMYHKLDRNLISNILEPSAGKGNILDYISNLSEYRYHRKPNLYAIEIDPELKDILYGKKYMVVANDFLCFKSYTRFDTVIMNPPFDEGHMHLLKALEVIKDGGQVVCLLNEETLLNPFSNDRKRLVSELERLNADIEYLGPVFKSAERKTDVRCAIVYVKIKASIFEDEFFKNIRFTVAEEIKQERGGDETALVKYDELWQLIEDYRTEVELYLASVRAANAYNAFAKPRGEHVSEISVGKTYDRNENDVDSMVKSIRYRYWCKALQSKAFEKYITNKKMKEITANLEKQSDVEFNLQNILEVKAALMGVFMGSLEESALAMFDEVTKHHQAEYSGNTHYYSGWKTNKASRINKKIILPYWTEKGLFTTELGKVLNYFDGFKEYENAGVGYSPKAGVYESEYFDVQIYLKGTMHITFKRLDLLDKLNMYVAQKRNWLPDANESTKNEREKIKKEVCQFYKPQDDFDYSITVSGQLLIA